jgi:Zn-dependent protease with chaperone function
MRAPATSGIDAPSVAGRAMLSLALLVLFYLFTLGIALAMLAFPVLMFLTTKASAANLRGQLFVTLLCWIPAGMLLMGILTVRRAWTPPRGRRLEESDAPELFSTLAELGALAGTAPPTAVYLTDRIDLAVTEMPTRRGGPKERVLFVGAPMLAWVTVAELRAGLAHELGHFAFGDTRLLGLVSHAHASFRNVIDNTRRSEFADTGIQSVEVAFSFARALGDAIVTNYAKVFFWLTRPGDRRAELAADQLAKRLAGPHAAVRLLEKVSLADVLYEEYLHLDVTAAVAAGGLPTDLTAGFATFSARIRELGISEKIEKAVRERKTDPFDAHPAVAERTAKLLEGASAHADANAGANADANADATADANADASADDGRAASSLVAIDVDAFLVESLLRAAAPALRSDRALARLTWAEMASGVYAPHLATRARDLAAQLFPTHTDARTAAAMFGAVVADVEGGRLEPVALALAPDLPEVAPHERAMVARAVVASALETLFVGALLERGAEVEASLGEPCFVLRYEGERVLAGVIARASMGNPAAARDVSTWAKRLTA